MAAYHHTPLDRFIAGADKALRVISGVASASRPTPAAHAPDAAMSEAECRHAAGLMRVNHVGEVCAQALYNAQARFARTEDIRAQFEKSSREEEDHLAWTAQRLGELNSHISVLNPFFYAGAYALGTVAAVLGDARSLGFVVETERQVEAHLEDHLQRLPPQDERSRAVLAQMQADEVRHAENAKARGGIDLPFPIPGLMHLSSLVMKSVAYRI